MTNKYLRHITYREIYGETPNPYREIVAMATIGTILFILAGLGITLANYLFK